MLRYLYADQLCQFPRLRASMFRDRADQFGRRLKWPVTVDAQGWERDDYDDLNPLYVIWERPDGLHGGSARFLPTTARIMVNDHFLHLTDGVAFRSPHIWECTRFCLAPGSGARIASALMLGGGEVMRAFNVDHFVGVFDAPMLRVYRGIGAVPDVLGSDGRVSVGLWTWDPVSRNVLLAKTGVSSELSEAWVLRAFGQPQALALAG
jgi:acyl homoserine lactone synthase